MELSAVKPSDSSVRPIESTFGWASGNSSTVAIWLKRQRLQAELRVGERLHPVGAGQMRKFGAQEIDRVLLLGDEMARLDELLGGVDRSVLDAVDVSRRADQRGDGECVQDTPHL